MEGLGDVWNKQLCWDCTNSTGNCPWSDDFTPVPGWDAKKSIFIDSGVLVESYEITACPLFNKGPYIINIDDIAKLLNCSTRTIHRLSNDEIIEKCQKHGHIVKYCKEHTGKLCEGNKIKTIWIYAGTIDNIQSSSCFKLKLIKIGYTEPTEVHDKYGNKIITKGLDIYTLVNKWRTHYGVHPSVFIELSMDKTQYDLINTKSNATPSIKDLFYKHKVKCIINNIL